jgi:hypothetical protein
MEEHAVLLVLLFVQQLVAKSAAIETLVLVPFQVLVILHKTMFRYVRDMKKPHQQQQQPVLEARKLLKPLQFQPPVLLAMFKFLSIIAANLVRGLFVK